MRSMGVLVAVAGCTGGAASPDAVLPGDDAGLADGAPLGPDARPDAVPYGPITITVVVSGSGRVISEPAGIDCTTACAAFFPRGDPVTLNAGAIDGWVFQGFEEACTGTGPCTLDGSADAIVQAHFVGDGSDLWIRQLGSTYTGETMHAVAVDAFGSVVVAGTSNGPIDFGGGPATTTGQFVARYAPDGSLHWLRLFGYGGSTSRVVATDASGDVFMAGGEGLVTRLSVVDGATVWTIPGPTATAINPRAVAVTPSGDVVVTGDYRQSVDFGDGPRPGGYYGSVFVARYAGGDGSLVWAATLFEAGFMSLGIDVAVDSAGNVIVGGLTQDTGSAADLPDAFVARFFAADGALDWSHVLGASSYYDAVWGVAAAGGDDVVVTGSFGGSVDFGGGPLDATANPLNPIDTFLVRYTSSGTHVWSRAMGGYGADLSRSLAMLPGDVVMVAGKFQELVRFGDDSSSDRASAGDYDAFVAAYASDGAFVTCAAFGGDGVDEAIGLGSSPSGAALVGNFSGTIELVGAPYVAIGPGDLVVIATSAPPIDDTDL